MSYATWFQQLNIPWLVGGPNGQAWWAGIGGVYDDQAGQLKAAIKCRFPTLAPPDALGFIGSERQLDRGPAETDPGYALRVRGAWETWARAGTPLGMLLALYYGGFPGAVLVQQNGNGYSITTPINSDPTTNLVVTTLDANPNLPGSPPWWTFDTNNVFCSRFAVLFPGPVFPGSSTTYATAAFVASDNALVRWNNAFPDTTYKILPGPATVTDGSGPVLIDVDATTRTTTGITVRASGPFTGSADILAYQVSSNPFADFHPNDLARMRAIVAKWRPAKATCVGIYVLVQGQFIGWPPRSISSSPAIGPATIVSYAP